MSRKKPAPAPPPLTHEQALALMGRILDRDEAGNFVIPDAEAFRIWQALGDDPEPPPATLEERYAELVRLLADARKSIEIKRRAALAQTGELVAMYDQRQAALREKETARGKLRRRKPNARTLERVREAKCLIRKGWKHARIANHLDITPNYLEVLLGRYPDVE
jgi:hypothetical protein